MTDGGARRATKGVPAQRAGARPHTNKGRHVERRDTAAPDVGGHMARAAGRGGARGGAQARWAVAIAAVPRSRCRPPAEHPPPRYITAEPGAAQPREKKKLAPPSDGELRRGYETVTAQDRLSNGGNGKPGSSRPPRERGCWRRLLGWERSLRGRGGRDLPLPEQLRFMLSLAVVGTAVAPTAVCRQPYECTPVSVRIRTHIYVCIHICI